MDGLALTLTRLLVEAGQRVADDQFRVARLRLLVASRREDGRDTVEAERLLSEFLQALAEDTDTRDRLAERLAGLVGY
jgi:hypothetical protein